MAKIITTQNCKRRTIRLTTDDVISIIKNYQQLIKNSSDATDARNILDDNIFYLPEDV